MPNNSDDLVIREAKNILIKNVPKNVNHIIREEQKRIDSSEKRMLKKYAVVIRIILDWYKQKNIIYDQHERIEELEKKLREASL
jgi:hypothetical protein